MTRAISRTLAAILVCAIAHIVTLLVGRFLFRMHPGILLGVCCGAGTSAPALAAVQEVAKSKTRRSATASRSRSATSCWPSGR